MKTNHVQISSGDSIYCHWTGNVTNYTPYHAKLYCFNGCPFFNGTAQGQGIECEFDSGSKDQIVYLDGGMPDAIGLRREARKFFKPDPNLPIDPDDKEVDEAE